MAEDWPDAVEVVNETGASDILLLCEHASNHVPKEYEGLGLGETDLRRHIAWDIGAADVARALAGRLDAACFLGTYSRLLIDLNRPLESPTSIPTRSEATVIPGNLELTEAERQRRIDRMFAPFHARVAAHLDTRLAAGRPTRLVTIHSYTPVFLGRRRPWHAGILFGTSRDLARRLIHRLAEDASLVVGANQPYVIDRMEDYAIPVHGEDRGLEAVLVEIRHDLIDTREGVGQWATRLENALDGI